MYVSFWQNTVIVHGVTSRLQPTDTLRKGPAVQGRGWTGAL